MHKGVILLVKATNREDAIGKVNTFMEPYGNGDVWDWFAIGNRWHNALAPTDKVKSFEEKAFKLYPQLKGAYAVNDVENSKDRPIIQQLWKDAGLKGVNPYFSSYGFDVEDSEEDYNVVPLAECMDTVKTWCLNRAKKAQEYWDKMLESKEKESAKKSEYLGGMSATYAGWYKTVCDGYFSFQCNVFNIDEEESETVPEDATGYYAVMVDMHN